MTIGEKIKKIRLSGGQTGKKLSQEDFAKSIELSRIAVALYESGDRTPSDKVLRTICNVYHIDPEWMFESNDTDIKFIDTTELFVDSLKKAYGLDDLGVSILQSYLQLDERDKQAVEKFIKNIAKGLE